MTKELFPWIKEPTAEELGIAATTNRIFRFVNNTNNITAPDPNHPNSLRTTRASWGTTRRTARIGNGNDPEKDADENELRRNGSRVILFSVGGLTYSEVRSAYEVTREEQREVFIGSTYVYNPIQFVNLLKNIHKGEEGIAECAPFFNAGAKGKDEITAEFITEPVADKKGGIFKKK